MKPNSVASTRLQRPRMATRSPPSAIPAKRVRTPACGPCRARKTRCDRGSRGSPCSGCQRRMISCTGSTDKRGTAQSHSQLVAKSSLHTENSASFSVYLKHGIGGQFLSAVQILLQREHEELLQLAWSAWEQRDNFVASHLKFVQAVKRASLLLSKGQHHSPDILAASILLATYAMHKDRIEHLKFFLHSIKVLIEAQSNIDFDDEIGQRLLPMSSLFIIYGTMARPEDIRNSMPLWDQCFTGTAHAARLGELATLICEIRLATAGELSRLAHATLAKTKSLCHECMRALPHEKPLAAEYLVVYWSFCLEIFKLKQSNQTCWLSIAQQIDCLSKHLQKLSLGGYCVASFPVWHAQTLVNGLWDPALFRSASTNLETRNSPQHA